MSEQPALARRLGLGDAVVVGLGSMVGAGVFVVWGPATAAAGGWVLGALALAALVAWCNASASAQLAVQHPTSGGAYVFGREHLGPWAGFVAGWGFVVGKTASCAAMALAVAAYVAPAGWERPLAVAVVVALGAVGYRGITRTARATRVLVLLVLACLTVAVTVALVGAGGAGGTGSTVGTGGTVGTAGAVGATTDGGARDPLDVAYGLLQAAGLLFFAFAGYARIATLAEEVREPRRTIPRAVALALAAATALYLVIGATLLLALGVAGTAGAGAPLAEAVARVGAPWAGPAGVVVGLGAVAASLGALLALLAGVSRTVLAMARGGDLPAALASVHPQHRVPHRAELVVVVVVCALVATVDLRAVVGFSSFGVLTYYLVANLAAWTQPAGHRLHARARDGLGAALCVLLALALPVGSVVAGAGVLAAGVVYRLLVLRRARGG